MAETRQRYKYDARDKAGNYRTGTIVATSADAIKQKFSEDGYTLLSEPHPVNNSGLNKEISFGGKGKRVKPKEVAAFARKFSSMQDASIPMKKSLNVLSNTKGINPTLRDAILDIEDNINAGQSLTESMRKHPLIFPPLMTALINAGEQTGFLDKSFRQVAENMEKEIRLRSKIRSAMTYPVVVLIMALIMVIGMMLFIVPIFSQMFESLGSELPLPTQILRTASDFLKIGIIPLAIAVIIFIAWWRRNKHKPYVRNFIDPLKLRLPVLGNLTQKIAMSRFSRNLSILISNGVPILQALTIVSETTGNVVVERALEDVKLSLRQGGTIADALAKHEVFPTQDVEMIRVGEEGGDYAPMLEKIAEIYDQDVEATTEALTSVIEPLLIVFLGGIVGTMVICLYLPVFEVSNAVKNAK